MKTEVVLGHKTHALSKAVSVLREGHCVGLPTETVYGLAADALNSEAVAKIFAAKHRPRLDPLIVHLPDRAWLEKLSRVPHQDSRLVEMLVTRFWPGPFTIVLPRRSIVPEIVTGGQETVALRMSAHSTFGEIIRSFGSPLAAPSANRFGRISPTTAQHVLDELDGCIPLLVDAGPTTLGIESTIVAIRDGTIEILRRGPVTEEELSAYGPVRGGTGLQPVAQNEEHRQDASATRIAVPGQFPSHYAPKTPLQLITRAREFSPLDGQRVGLLAWHTAKDLAGYAEIRFLSVEQHLPEAAKNLFRLLRELDAAGLDLIVAEQLPEHGLGGAIMDRLRRAAHR